MKTYFVLLFFLVAFCLSYDLQSQITLGTSMDDSAPLVTSSDLLYNGVNGHYEFNVRGGPGYCRLQPNSLPITMYFPANHEVFLRFYPGYNESPIFDINPSFEQTVTFESFPTGATGFIFQFVEAEQLIGLSTTELLPVELISFTGMNANGKVLLSWQTATEVNNYGFEIERSKVNNQMSNFKAEWEKIGFVEGNGNSNALKEYMFVDQEYEQEQDGIVKYRLKQIDNDGKYQYSKEVEVGVSTSLDFNLEQNYPNPFNPSTVISWQLAVGGFVSLKVYDALGNEVATLVNEVKEAGKHEVEFRSIVGSRQLASGVYFYKIVSGNYSEIKKMVLLQ